MVSEAIGNEARRRSDDAVRRLREESRRRIEQQGRWRACSSWCALATLAAGISLAALDARQADLQAAQAAEENAAIASARANERQRLMEKLAAIEKELTRKTVAWEEWRGGGDCSITINSIPWSEVWIDGKNTTRHTPLVDYNLPCGKHRIAFKRPDMQFDQTESINLRPGHNFKQRYTLANDD